MSIPEQQPNEVFFKITFLFIAPWFLNEYYRLTRNYGKKKAIKILNGVLVNDYFKIYNCKDLPFKNCDDLVGFVLLKTQVENYNLYYHAANEGKISYHKIIISDSDAELAQHAHDWISSVSQIVVELLSNRKELLEEFWAIHGLTVKGEVWENTLKFNKDKIRRSFWNSWKKRQKSRDFIYC